MIAAAIRDDSHIHVVKPQNGQKFIMEELRIFTESRFVERVPLGDEFEMWVNEDGKLQALPPNHIATGILRKTGRDDTVVGQILICSVGMVDLEGGIL